jgi:DNA-binding NtrC family response regulator
MHISLTADGAVLVLLLEGCRPLASSSCHDLRGLAQVTIEHAAMRRWHRRVADGMHTLVIGVPDPMLVSHHVRLTEVRGRWLVEGVAGEIFVNGMHVRTAPLADGDLVTVGDTVFCFRDAAMPIQASPGTTAELDVDATAVQGPTTGLDTLCPRLARSFGDLAQLAPVATPILLSGETGTGKEIAARAVHALARRPGPFVAVNCGALPITLVESELFGYRKGAFSGAFSDRLGLIRSAEGGTLFLDEIGDLPPPSQAALLRVLQEREVMPLGANRSIPVDIKLVCATHRDLRQACERGQFRSDLYARLAGFVLHLPPLRDRRIDFGILITAILRRLAPDRDAVRFTAAGLHALFAHDWPHNIRELDSALGVALALARGAAIDAPHLPEAVRAARRPRTGGASPEAAAHRDRLEAMLREHRGNISAIARVMSRSRMQVHRWLKRYQLSPRDFRP